MNYVKASCGHPTLAVGAPGSPARKACESEPCRKCLRRISKQCQTLRQAERFAEQLYDEYQTVELIQSPLFSEDGYYCWRVG